MAINSKTVIGKDSGEQSERMMKAAAIGQESQAQAHAQLMQQERWGAEQVGRTAGQVAEIIGQGEQMKQRESQFGRQLELEAADKGLVREGQQAAPAGLDTGAAKAGSPREQALQAEMERGKGVGPISPEAQQNLKSQGEKPMEREGGRWIPGPERVHAERRKDFQAQTERMAVTARLDALGLQHQKAVAKGDTEEAENLAIGLSKGVNEDVERFDRLMKNTGTEDDWGRMKKKASELGMGIEPTLAADLDKKVMTPRVKAFAADMIARDGLEYMVRTGDTSKIKVDWTHPKMREFSNQLQEEAMRARMLGPEFAQQAGINSVESKMRYLNRMASMMVLQGFSQSTDPTGGTLPSAGGPAEPGAPQPGAAPAGPAAKGWPQRMAEDVTRTIPDDFPHRKPLGRGTGEQRWDQLR